MSWLEVCGIGGFGGFAGAGMETRLLNQGKSGVVSSSLEDVTTAWAIGESGGLIKELDG